MIGSNGQGTGRCRNEVAEADDFGLATSRS